VRFYWAAQVATGPPNDTRYDVLDRDVIALKSEGRIQFFLSPVTPVFAAPTGPSGSSSGSSCRQASNWLQPPASLGLPDLDVPRAFTIRASIARVGDLAESLQLPVRLPVAV
jgi:hypothetical protein